MSSIDQQIEETRHKLNLLRQARKVGHEMHEQFREHLAERKAKAMKRLGRLLYILIKGDGSPLYLVALQKHLSATFEDPRVIVQESMLCYELHRLEMITRQYQIVKRASDALVSCMKGARQNINLSFPRTEQELLNRIHLETKAWVSWIDSHESSKVVIGHGRAHERVIAQAA